MNNDCNFTVELTSLKRVRASHVLCRLRNSFFVLRSVRHNMILYDQPKSTEHHWTTLFVVQWYDNDKQNRRPECRITDLLSTPRYRNHGLRSSNISSCCIKVLEYVGISASANWQIIQLNFYIVLYFYFLSIF